MSTREAGNDWWCRQRLVMQPETERGDPELERAYERWLPPNLSSHYCLEWDRSCELEDIHRRLEYCFCFGKLFGWNSCNICHLKPLTTMISAWTLKCHITQLSAKAVLQILQTPVIEHVQLSISICSWCRQAGAFVVIE